MKALSGRQPWFWLLLHGKPIENRPWSTTYRGPVLLHASKRKSDTEEQRYDLAVRAWVATHISQALADSIPALEELPRGVIFGRAVLAHVLHPFNQEFAGVGPQVGPLDRRWHMTDPCSCGAPRCCWPPADLREAVGPRRIIPSYGFVLTELRPLKPIPYRGELGLFEVPDEIGRRCVA